MLTLLVKNEIAVPSDRELAAYERRIREVKFAHAFTQPTDFDEIQHLKNLISERSKGIERLIKGLSLNSSIMTHTEVEIWKSQFTLLRNDLILHKNIAAFKFPKDFPAK